MRRLEIRSSSLFQIELVLEIRFSFISITVHKIARELTGQRRNRLFAYDGYLATLKKGIAVRDRAR